MNEESKAYALYALKPSEANITGAIGERFTRITPEYILVYTDGGQPINSIRLESDDLHRLTRGDSEWLFICNFAVIREAMERKEPEILDRLSDTINYLEAALEKETANADRDEGEIDRR